MQACNRLWLDAICNCDNGVADAAALFDKGVAALRDSGRLAALLQPYAEMSTSKPVAATRSGTIVPAVLPLRKSGGLIKVANTVKKGAAGKVPALFTEAQATNGQQVFMANCAMCHGTDLGGLSGSALKGAKFASPKDKFAVSDIFNIMSQQMPAGRPGALAKDEYAAIMSFLLQQNGYPAGAQMLSYDDAAKSKVPLIYRGE
jgi:mono/diheme cytochrome c family protein